MAYFIKIMSMYTMSRSTTKMIRVKNRWEENVSVQGSKWCTCECMKNYNRYGRAKPLGKWAHMSVKLFSQANLQSFHLQQATEHRPCPTRVAEREGSILLWCGCVVRGVHMRPKEESWGWGTSTALCSQFHPWEKASWEDRHMLHAKSAHCVTHKSPKSGRT